jgi:hypothetical protein
MPMTFPSHQGLILPVVRRWPDSFDVLALSVGAAMPDITDTILGFSINGYFKQWYGHALIGIFTLDFIGGLFITWLIAVLVTQFFKNVDLPQPLRPVFTNASQSSDLAGGNRVLRWQSKLGLWSFSVLVGILSHIGFDLISHDTNLLLYPWYENPQWFPGWWYTAWFENRPLVIFGHSYEVGIFTVSWCILSLIGVFLFFQFLDPKQENKV